MKKIIIYLQLIPQNKFNKRRDFDQELNEIFSILTLWKEY